MIREIVRGQVIGGMQPSYRGRFYLKNCKAEGEWIEGDTHAEITKKAKSYWLNDWYLQEYYPDGCEFRIFQNK